MSAERRKSLVPVARFDPEFDPKYNKIVTPYIARLLPGPQLTGMLKHVDWKRHSNVEHFIGNGFAMAFAYIPDAFSMPETLLLVDQCVTQEIFIASTVLGGEMLDPVRRRLLWFIYDVLGFDAPNAVDGKVKIALQIPDMVRQGYREQILRCRYSLRLKKNLRRHRMISELIEREEEALTHQPDSLHPAYQFFIDQTGRAPNPNLLHSALTSRHALRLEIFDLSNQISRFFQGSNQGNSDRKTLAHPYTQRRLKDIHHRSLLHLEPGEKGEMVWTLWKSRPFHGLYSEHPGRAIDLNPHPLAMSTKGPIELLHQAGVVVYGLEEFEEWLDRTLIDGILLYDPEPYDLLDEQPLLWNSQVFRKWATSLEMEES